MKNLKNVSIFAIMILSTTLAAAQQTSPTYIEVDGNKLNALKLLKAGGIQAKETVDQKFIPPVVTIDGGGAVDLGEQVILTADFDKNSLPEGLVDMTFNWTVLDAGKQKRYFVGDGGRSIAFGVGVKPKKMTILLDVNCLFESKQKFMVVDKDGKNPIEKEFITAASAVSPVPISSEVIVGGGDDPTPTPNPLPNPNPIPTPVTPTFPDGQFGLAKFVYNAFMADTNIDAKTKVALADKLANGLDGIVSKSVAVQVDVPTILADTKKSNDAAFASLGIDLSRTQSLKTLISSKVRELWDSQKINNVSDIRTAWTEMSQGLHAIK